MEVAGAISADSLHKLKTRGDAFSPDGVGIPFVDSAIRCNQRRLIIGDRVCNDNAVARLSSPLHAQGGAHDGRHWKLADGQPDLLVEIGKDLGCAPWLAASIEQRCRNVEKWQRWDHGRRSRLGSHCSSLEVRISSSNCRRPRSRSSRIPWIVSRWMRRDILLGLSPGTGRTTRPS
jgi:hypothetical protein